MATVSCPSCGHHRTWKLRREKRKCKRCRREFGVRTYPVSGFRVDVECWQQAVATFLRERTAARVADAASVSLKTAQRMTHRLRVCMTEDIPEVFLGPVEMDETYIGGQRKNKRLHIRRIAGKKGHGTDKLPIVGIFDRATGTVFVVVEPKKLDMTFIVRTIQGRVVSGAHVFTDGFKMYRGLPKHGFPHCFVDHLQGEYVRGDVHTNNIEGFWGIMKRKIGCIGGMRRKFLHLFVGEIVWKFNRRHLSMEEREQRLLTLVFRS